MGSVLCPETANLEPTACGNGKHASRNTTKACANEHCFEKTVVCCKCGTPSKDDTNKLLCNMCAITAAQNESDSEGDDDDSLVQGRKSSAPKMTLEYSASRDPSKLGEGARTASGGFKVGTNEHEDKIKATLNNK